MHEKLENLINQVLGKLKEAKEKFGGKNLENHLKNINEIADDNQKKSNYKAEIYYKIV